MRCTGRWKHGENAFVHGVNPSTHRHWWCFSRSIRSLVAQIQRQLQDGRRGEIVRDGIQYLPFANTFWRLYFFLTCICAESQSLDLQTQGKAVC
jgi:hypothetical protein